MIKKIECRVTESELLTNLEKGMQWYSLEHEMTPQTLKSWIAALRSDDYMQIDGELFGKGTNWNTATDDYEGTYKGYCCLGVLGSICGISDDLLSQDTLLVGDEADTTGMLVERHDYDNPIGTEKYPHTLQDLLSRMNDDGWTFARIADWIEENLLIDDDEIHV